MPKVCIFDALLRGKAGFLVKRTRQNTTVFHALLHDEAGFLVTCQKCVYIMHFSMEKLFFL